MNTITSTRRVTISDFDSAARYLADVAPHPHRAAGNNTYVMWLDDDTIGVRLHSTYVVRYHRDGSIRLHSGGWATSTTVQRMHAFTPSRIRVNLRKRSILLEVDGVPVDYYDGIVIPA